MVVEQLVVRVPLVPATCSTRASRRSGAARRHLLRPEGQREHHPRNRQRPPFTGLTYDNVAKVMKRTGRHEGRHGGLRRESASSTAAAKTAQDYAGPGGRAEGRATRTRHGRLRDLRRRPVVLGIKNSGADAAYLQMVAQPNIAIVQGLQQNGVDDEGQHARYGLRPGLLDSPVGETLEPNTASSRRSTSRSRRRPGRQAVPADLKKYAGLTGVPDYGQYTGYITATWR